MSLMPSLAHTPPSASLSLQALPQDDAKNSLHSYSRGSWPLSCLLFQTKTCQTSCWISPNIHPIRWSLMANINVCPHFKVNTSVHPHQLFSLIPKGSTTAHRYQMPNLYQVLVAHGAQKMLDPHHLQEVSNLPLLMHLTSLMILLTLLQLNPLLPLFLSLMGRVWEVARPLWYGLAILCLPILILQVWHILFLYLLPYF